MGRRVTNPGVEAKLECERLTPCCPRRRPRTPAGSCTPPSSAPAVQGHHNIYLMFAFYYILKKENRNLLKGNQMFSVVYSILETEIPTDSLNKYHEIKRKSKEKPYSEVLVRIQIFPSAMCSTGLHMLTQVNNFPGILYLLYFKDKN